MVIQEKMFQCHEEAIQMSQKAIGKDTECSENNLVGIGEEIIHTNLILDD